MPTTTAGLREQGYTDAMIQRLYGYASPTSVSRLSGLLSLDSSLQTLVHRWEMSVETALLSLKLDATERNRVIKEAVKANGRVAGPKIRDAVREKIINDDAKPRQTEFATNSHTPASSRGVSLTLSELRKMVAEGQEEENDDYRRLWRELGALLAGRKGLKAFQNAVGKIFAAK